MANESSAIQHILEYCLYRREHLACLLQLKWHLCGKVGYMIRLKGGVKNKRTTTQTNNTFNLMVTSVPSTIVDTVLF